ncbi:hypothetical protein CN994_14695 [Bacillus anthracis]|nr:hypothetical protein CN994_14695 [Bacillus anthracis]
MTFASFFFKYKPLFKQRHFTLLSFAESISSLGNMAQGIALSAYVFTISQSLVVYGLFLLVRFAPQFILFPLSGAIADKFSRRYTTTVINGLLFLISIVMAIYSESTTVILVMSLLAGIVDLPYRPALSASIPTLIPKDQLPLANGFMGILKASARIIGSAVAAIGLLTGGVIWLFIFNALTFFLAGIISWISLPTKNQEDKNNKPVDVTKKENGEIDNNDIKSIVAYMWTHSTLKKLVFGSALVWGCISLSDVLLVPLLNVTIDGGEKYYGVYRLIAAIGMLLGAHLSVSWCNLFSDPRRLPYGYAIPLVILSVSTIGLAIWPIKLGFIFYFLAWIAMFLPANLLEIELQLTPSTMRGKVIAFADALDGVLFILLITVLPQINHFVKVQTLLWVMAVPFLLIGVIWILKWVTNHRKFRVEEKEGI